MKEIVSSEQGAADVSAQSMDAQKECAEEEKGGKRDIRKMIVAYIKRYLILVVGLCIMSIGVAFSIKAGLGTSPISSVPYVLNLITGLSIGTTTIIANSVIVLLQILILRKKYQPIQLLQVLVAVVFGLLTDVAVWCVEGVVLTAYWQQWLICIAGIVLVAVGVSFEVAAHVVTLPGEGLALALCRVIRLKFGYMKVIVDVSLVVIAVALSFGFLPGLQGVREGTLAAAVFVGLLAKQFNRLTVPLADKWIEGNSCGQEGNRTE